MEHDLKIRKLSPRQFARAVRLGHGSALLHVRAYGDANLEKTILNALLNSYVYDWQIEGSRQYWLFCLVEASGRTSYYAERFLEQIKIHFAKGNDRAQQILLCGQFFEAGCDGAREAAFRMYPALIESNVHRVSCGRALINMAGEIGFKFVSKNLSDMCDNIDSYECASLYEHAEEVLNYSSAAEDIFELVEKNPDSRRFFQAVKEFKDNDRERPSYAKSRPVKQGLDSILKMIKEKKFAKHGLQYGRLGQNLDRHEISALFELLQKTQDPWEQLCFLRIFEFQKLPSVTPELLNLLNSSNRMLTIAASQAFGAVKNILVREKALELLASGSQKKIVFGTELLNSNYVSGDAELILKGMKRLKDLDRLHSAGMDVQSIAKKHRDPGLENLILWLYENGPDSFCRNNFLEQMLEWNICPPQTLYEAQWDCNDDLQMKARGLLADRG